MGWGKELFLGLDAGLALGGATLDLTPPEYDGEMDLFWDWLLDLLWVGQL